MTRIVVTGHLGFVGRRLTQYLDNKDFIGLDRKEGNDILTCDLPEAEVVIHLAAEPGVIDSVKDPYKSAENNILGTIRLAQKYKDARFIFASSGGTIQEKIESPYGLSKYTAEKYIEMLCNDPVILRFPNVYGENSRSVVDKWLAEDTLTIYGDGNTYRIFAHVDDVVRAIVQSLDWEKGLYHLGTNDRYSVKEVAATMRKPIIYEPARRGEITHDRSMLVNTTPDWEAEVELMEYIDDRV